MKTFRRSKFLVIALTAAFFLECLSMPSQAWSLWPWGEAETQNKDVRFSTIYPEPFLQSTTGKITLYVGSAVVVGAITYFTAGTGTAAGAGYIATFVGGTIGALKGLSGIAAINAGLALLGGGSVASGGLGILGGITLLNVIGDFAVAVAIDGAMEAMPASSTHEFLDVVKLRMFYDGVSPVVEDDLEDLEESFEQSDLEKVDFFLRRIENKLIEEVRNKTDETTAYNHLMLAIIQYNNQNFANARASVASARNFTDPGRSSLLDYVDALISLVEGNETKCIDLLSQITQQEPEAIPPYVVLAQIDIDKEQYYSAFNTLKTGLSAADNDDCTLNWMAGNCLYAYHDYKQAIPYYRSALSNMTQNEMEAMYKLNIAKCYRKLGDSHNGGKWLDDAISEVKDNETMVSELRAEYAKD